MCDLKKKNEVLNKLNKKLLLNIVLSPVDVCKITCCTHHCSIIFACVQNYRARLSDKGLNLDFKI